MATISDISIIDTNTAPATPVDSGVEREICSAALCGSKNLTAYRRTVADGKTFAVGGDDDYHLVYVMGGSSEGHVSLGGETRGKTDEGAGVLLTPGETAAVEAKGGDVELLHLVTPQPPKAVEGDLPGGPGYFFNRSTLRALSDASGGRVRRFCAESSVRFPNGERLTLTNAIQAGEMHYNEGGASPYHRHNPTDANPEGAAHCYMTFKGRGRVDVGDTSQNIEPGTLVYFPPGVPHQLNALDGPLDYFEIQAWRSFKTDILSKDPLGLKWYYEQKDPAESRVEWNQS